MFDTHFIHSLQMGEEGRRIRDLGRFATNDFMDGLFA